MPDQVQAFHCKKLPEPIRVNELFATADFNEAFSQSEDTPSLFFFELRPHSYDYSFCFSLLTDTEKIRAEKFKHQGAKDLFVVSHGVLHWLLRKYLRNEYDQVDLKESEYHKPFIEIADGVRPLEFNLSHCEGFVALAFDKGAIGIDIENIKPLDDLKGMCDQVFTPMEKEYVFQYSETRNQLRRFFKLWTCKEAVLKANGTGFMKDPKSLEIIFCQGNGPIVPDQPSIFWSDSIPGRMAAWSRNLETP